MEDYIKLLEEIAKEVREKLGISVYRRMVERVLTGINTSSDFWKIVDIAEQPVPIVSEIVKSLLGRGIIYVENEEIFLTEEGKKIVKTLKLEILKEYVCPKCNGRGIHLDPLKDVYEKFVEITKDRPVAIIEFDQGYVTPESTVARVAFADYKGDVRNKDIIIMGDDDLVSIALALTKLPRSVVVVEIDKRLTDFIERVSREIGFPVETVTMDLRKPVPSEFLARFDTFFTDPPETEHAIRAFVSRGIALLKGEGSAGYIGYTLRDSSLLKWKMLQAMLLEYGAVVTDIINNFNDYYLWDYHEQTKAHRIAPVKRTPKDIWYRSSIYRIEVLPGFKRENNPINVGMELYLDIESSTT